MRIPIEWAKKQFRLLSRRDLHDLAVHLLAVHEASALLANTLRDPGISCPGRPVSSTAGSTHCDRVALVLRPVKLWPQSGPRTEQGFFKRLEPFLPGRGKACRTGSRSDSKFHSGFS
jgi:hypothetical protein